MTVKPKKLELKAAIVHITGFDPLDTEVQNRLVPAGTQWDALALETSGYQVDDDVEPTAEPLTVEGVAWEIDPENPTNEGNSAYNPEIGSYCLPPFCPRGTSWKPAWSCRKSM